MRIVQRRAAAFGLIESLTVLAIAALTLAVAAPSFKAWLERHRVSGVASELAADLAFLRSEAVARGTSTRISFRDTPEGSCYVLHTGGPDACPCPARPAVGCAAGAEALKSVLLPSSLGVRVRTTAASLAFHPSFGTVTPAGTIEITGPSGTALRHVVNLVGRVRTCAPEQRFGAYPGC